MIEYDFGTYNRVIVKNEDLLSYGKINTEIKNEFDNGSLSQWLNIETYTNQKEVMDIVDTADYIKNNCDVFIVIGIGGSYMGAKAVIEALTPRYKVNKPKIIFFGKNMNPNEYVDLLNYIEDKEVMVNVISKSGTTLEPSIAFDLIKKAMEKKYPKEELRHRIFITTDKEEGSLRALVNEEGYKSFIVPSNVGGRYSVLTPVGLLPIAVADIKIDKLLFGAKKAMAKELGNAFFYSTIRDIMLKKGKIVESFTIYDERLYYFTEWLKQLFAETQGKEGRGILPISNINTRDLHSMGQFLQEGNKIIFETVLAIRNNSEIKIDKYDCSLNSINNMSIVKVAEAHRNGNTPSSLIWVNDLNEETLGYLIQFFMMAAIIGGKQLNINPFDQPGVQEYKRLVTEGLNNREFTN